MDTWNPWKVAALAMAFVLATALVTGLVVANWSGSSREVAQPVTAPPSTRLIQQPRPTAVRPVPAQTVRPRPAGPSIPTREIVDACNRYASAQVGESDKTTAVFKDAAIGAGVGSAVGAAGDGKGAGKGAEIGGVVGAGTLYGLNETNKNDEKYRAAYSGCLQSRGYTG